MNKLLIILGSSLLLAAVAVALFLFQEKNHFKNDVILPAVTQDNYTHENNTIGGEETLSSKVDKKIIEVEWLDKLVDVCVEDGACDDKFSKVSERYIAGKIINGEFSGKDLYLTGTETIGGSDYYHHILLDGKEFALEDDKFIIKGISDLPEKINVPDSKYQLVKHYSPIMFSRVKIVKTLFVIDGIGEFILAENGCIIIELPDHTAIGYDLDIPFLNKENGRLNIEFSDGENSEEEYSYRKMTCNGPCVFFQFVEDKESFGLEEKLIMAGITSNGDKIYKLKDSQDPVLKELYNDKNTHAYYYGFNTDPPPDEPKSKYSYQEFIDFRPLLYWQDFLGRWIEFKNERFDIVAEMCKPVIYLYPESESRLNVQVDPIHGFTKTIPEYLPGGWDVTAYSDGRIVNDSTGKNYDYLYWSGISLGEFESKEGWVIEKNALGSFFDEKLKKLGMNDKEIYDFKEYWLGRLTDMPYYKISFIPKNIIDDLAPMKISPKTPDFLLRVYILVRGLDKHIEITEQQLPKTPMRKGFAVVEWGGIYKCVRFTRVVHSSC